MSDERQLVDPWTGDLCTPEEAAERCYWRAEWALTWRYRLWRLWKGYRTGIWEPTAAQLFARGDWVSTLAAIPGQEGR